MGRDMGRALNRLTNMTVNKLNAPGHYGDGGGLWLQISDAGTKSWVFRFTRDGRSREMGLGALHTVSLADARAAALNVRKQLQEGIDPIEHRRAQRQAAQLLAARAMTFDQCAAAYIDSHRAGWKNAKHADQWESTLKAYASPIFGSLPVADIDTALVMKCIEPLWKDKTETASRLRGRIESILDWATVRGYRQGENPARWRGHLESLLPARKKAQQVEHHAALPYAELPTFMQSLRKQTGVAALAFEFCILTATRTSETMGARWEEFDLDARLWTIPAARMKANREHRVPLSDRCLQILAQMQAFASDWVFPGARAGKPLSNMAFLMCLRRMDRPDLTAHGFRSTFRDWCAESTNYAHEVAEMALAHTVSDAVEAAYRRGDLLQKRYQLMADWAARCA